MSTVVMILSLMAIISYFYDFSDIELTGLKEISELNYLPFVKESLNNTVYSFNGDCAKLQDDLAATSDFLEDKMMERGIRLNVTYDSYTGGCPPVNFTFTIKTENLYTMTEFISAP